MSLGHVLEDLRLQHFAAAALSCSHTLPDLVSNGVEAVLAAFRTALKSFLVGRSLSSQVVTVQQVVVGSVESAERY